MSGYDQLLEQTTKAISGGIEADVKITDYNRFKAESTRGGVLNTVFGVVSSGYKSYWAVGMGANLDHPGRPEHLAGGCFHSFGAGRSGSKTVEGPARKIFMRAAGRSGRWPIHIGRSG